MMNWGYGYMMGLPYGGWGGLMMILWWGLVIAVVVMIAKWLMNQTEKPPHSGNHALDILKERYAKGEISQQEFTDKKRDIL